MNYYIEAFKNISDHELHSDLSEALADIELCKIALAKGVDDYNNGKDTVAYRLQANKNVVATIENIIAARKHESIPSLQQ